MIYAAITAAVLSSCGTVAPKVVDTTVIDWSGTKQDAGVLYDVKENGKRIQLGVNQYYIDRYNALIAMYGARFTPQLRKGAGYIETSTPGEYLIDIKHDIDKSAMERWRRNREAVDGMLDKLKP